MTFEEWLSVGYHHRWVAEGCCSTHDAAPMTPEEQAEFDAGFDPCIPVLRVWTENT